MSVNEGYPVLDNQTRCAECDEIGECDQMVRRNDERLVHAACTTPPNAGAPPIVTDAEVERAVELYEHDNNYKTREAALRNVLEDFVSRRTAAGQADDSSRLDTLQEWCDGLEFRIVENGVRLASAKIVLDWFIGDGSQPMMTVGANWREAIDAFNKLRK